MLQRRDVGMWTADYDYVRLTWSQEAGLDEAESLYIKAAHYAMASQTGIAPVGAPWAWRGYYGTDFGVVQVGRGPQGCILQCSGSRAAAVRELAPPWTGVPRVDVAVTVWYKRDPGGELEMMADGSAAASRDAGGAAWRVSHIRGYGSGDTVYLGSRRSEVFCRIYDKGRESEGKAGYENALRYEVEVKGSWGARLWEGEARAAPDRHWLASQVQSVLRGRAVYLALPEQVACPVVPRETPEEATDDSRLAWLHNQVRPAVDRLLKSGVHYTRVLEVLGLS